MKRVFLAITIIITLTLFSAVVYAANPADLTTNHRPFISEFYKVGYDDGPRFACVNWPLDETANFQIFNWQNRKGDVRSSQLIIAKKFSSWLDGAVDVIFTEDVIFTGNELSENVIADAHWGALGVGLIMPLEYGGDLKVGPRVTILGLTTFATLSKVEKPLWGFSRALVKGVKAEIAYGSDTWFVRVCREFKTSFGTFVPESRNKLTEEENFFGLALGFIPNPN